MHALCGAQSWRWCNTVSPLAGKIVVLPPALRIDSVAITGGLGGVGMQCARDLAPYVSRLLLAGRGARQPPPVPCATCIDVLRLDVGMASDMGSLHGLQPHVVLHSSGALADGVVVNQSLGTVRRVWASKAAGACLQGLHRASLQLPMHCTVLFSSVAVPLAAPGQVWLCLGNCMVHGSRTHVAAPLGQLRGGQ